MSYSQVFMIDFVIKNNLTAFAAEARLAEAATTKLAATMALAQKTGMSRTAALGQLQTQLGQAGFQTSIRTAGADFAHFASQIQKGVVPFKQAREELRLLARDATFTSSKLARMATENVRMNQTQLGSVGKNAKGVPQFVVGTPSKANMSLPGAELMRQQELLKFKQSTIHAMSNDLVNAGKQAQWTGRQLTMGISLPLAAIGAAAAVAFNSVDKALVNVTKVYGDTVKVGKAAEAQNAYVRKMATDTASDLARQYGQAATESIDLMAQIAATGKQGTDLQVSTTETTRLMVLGEVERQDAMNTTLSLTNAFGIKTEELANTINYLNAVENQTSLTLQDMTVAIPKAGTVVKSLGGDVKDLAEFMVAMKVGGIDAAEGANALKTILARIIQPTGQATDLLKSYGINIKKLSEKDKGDVKKMMLDLREEIQNNIPEVDQAKVYSVLFGKWQFTKGMALMNNMNSEQVKEAEKMGSQSAAELAARAKQETDTITQSVSGRWKIMIESIKVDMAKMGEPIMEVLVKVGGVLERLISGFNSLPGGIKAAVAALGLFLVAVGPIVMMWGLLKNLTGNLMKGANFAYSVARYHKRPETNYEVNTQEKILERSMAQFNSAVTGGAANAETFARAIARMNAEVLKAAAIKTFYKNNSQESWLSTHGAGIKVPPGQTLLQAQTGAYHNAAIEAGELAYEKALMKATGAIEVNARSLMAQTGAIDKNTGARVTFWSALEKEAASSVASTATTQEVSAARKSTIKTLLSSMLTEKENVQVTQQLVSAKLKEISGVTAMTSARWQSISSGRIVANATTTGYAGVYSPALIQSARASLQKVIAGNIRLAGETDKYIVSLTRAQKIGNFIKGPGAMGLGMGAMMASAVIPEGGPGGSLDFLKGGLGGVGMGAMVGSMVPLPGATIIGAVGGGILGTAIPAIQKMNEATEEFNAKAKAEFETSTFAAEQFGVAIKSAADIDISKFVRNSDEMIDKIKQLANAINQTPEGSPEKTIVDKLKGENIDEAVKTAINQYKTLLAQNINPEDIRTMIAAELSLANKTPYLQQIDIEISKTNIANAEQARKDMVESLRNLVPTISSVYGGMGYMGGQTTTVTTQNPEYWEKLAKAMAMFPINTSTEEFSKLNQVISEQNVGMEAMIQTLKSGTEEQQAMGLALENLSKEGITNVSSALAILNARASGVSINFADIAAHQDNFQYVASAIAAANTQFKIAINLASTLTNELNRQKDVELANLGKTTKVITENQFKKQQDAAKKAQDVAKEISDQNIKNMEENFKKQEEAMQKHIDAVAKKYDKEIKAIQDAEAARKKAFDAEQTRISRENEQRNMQIDYQKALDTGDYFGAMTIESNIAAKQQSYSLQDQDKAAGDAAQNKIDKLSKEKDKEISKLQKQAEAQKKANDQAIQGARDRADAEQKAYEAQTEAAQKFYDKQNKGAKKEADALKSILEKKYADAAAFIQTTLKETAGNTEAAISKIMEYAKNNQLDGIALIKATLKEKFGELGFDVAKNFGENYLSYPWKKLSELVGLKSSFWSSAVNADRIKQLTAELQNAKMPVAGQLGSGAKVKVPHAATGAMIKYDNTIANLHKDEAVLTAPLTRELIEGIGKINGGIGGNTYVLQVDKANASVKQIEDAYARMVDKHAAKIGRPRK